MTDQTSGDPGLPAPAQDTDDDAGARAVVARDAEGGADAAAAPEVGVGPWEGPWPEGDHWDPELLEHGDRRNVLDQYRYWKHDAIVAELDTRRHDFHVAIEIGRASCRERV